MIRIAPSILSADFSCLRQELSKIEEARADMVHLDIMDGHFVPTMTIGPIVVEALRPHSKLPFDVHLMVENPDRHIKAFNEAGADIITVHAEASRDLARTVSFIKSLGLKAGVSINPSTHEDAVKGVLNMVDMVLVMTVNPGYGGQKFIDGLEAKVGRLRELISNKGLAVDIEVDGGINIETIGRVVSAGANVIVTGSAFFQSEDPAEFVAKLRRCGA
jgi:ribulose-phosphate 3-epimerase